MNINHSQKGFNKRLDDALPFSSTDVNKFQYLEKISEWVKLWENLKQKSRHG